MDDASTDDTAAIANTYPDVRYIRTEHRNPHLARRDGIHASTADSALFVQTDNHLPREYAANGLACFDSPNVAVVWRKDTAGKNYPIKRGTGVEQIAGCGFGCLVLRREVIDGYAVQIPQRALV